MEPQVNNRIDNGHRERKIELELGTKLQKKEEEAEEIVRVWESREEKRGSEDAYRLGFGNCREREREETAGGFG